MSSVQHGLSVLFVALVFVVACAESEPVDDRGPDGGTIPDGGDDPDSGIDPNDLPVIESFVADPRGLLAGGGTATLSWQVDGADSLAIDNAVGEVSGESVTVTVTETTTFTLTATNAEGSSSQSTPVLVGSETPVTLAFADPMTSIEAIEQALTDGVIDEIDALRFKVFAVFADPRLPAEYDVEGVIHGWPIMRELASRFPALPTEVQEQLRPFMIAPGEPGSWYEGSDSLQRVAPKGATGLYDRSMDVANGGVRILWESRLTPQGQAWVQETLAPAVAGAYQDLVALMGVERRPIPHTGNRDEPYRVFLVDKRNVDWNGLTTPASFNSDLGGFPSHVQVNLRSIQQSVSSFQGLTEWSASTSAHELMHAIQNSFDTVDLPSAQALLWLEEATATWATHYVYPFFNVEHRFADDYLDVPSHFLDDLAGSHEYGGYLFPLFLENEAGGASTIREIHENTEFAETLAAIDLAVEGELDELWPKFTAYNWNRDPLTFHQTWDSMTRAVAENVEIEPVKLTSGQQQQVYEMSLLGPSARGPLLGVDYLAARYYHFDLTDPGPRSILFANGFSFELQEGTPAAAPADVTLFATELVPEELDGRHVYVLVKADGEWLPDAFDVTDVAFVPFCQDYAEERIEELVFIFSNSRWLESDRIPLAPLDLSPRLFVSNFSCGDWVGDGALSISIQREGYNEITSVTLENLFFTRSRNSREALLAGAGEFDFLGQITPYDASAVAVVSYGLETADVQWTTSINSQVRTNICTTSGSGMMSANDAMLSFFELRPSLLGPTDSDGSIYRSFYVNLLFNAPGLPVTQVCTETGTSMGGFISDFVGGRRNTEFGTLLVDPDGSSIDQTWTLDDAAFQMNLFSFPDP